MADDGLLLEFAQQLVKQALTNCLNALEKANDKPIWPIGSEFSPDTGQECVELLVKQWALDESWKHCIDYQGLRDGLHCYRVLCSQPHNKKPVPRAAAAVYVFVLNESTESPVKALYVVEGQRLVHWPGKDTFKEIWLTSVISNKMAILNSYS